MTTNPRLLRDVLTLYKSTFCALKELIDNSIQALATRVEIVFVPSSVSQDDITYHSINEIEITDNGVGVPYSLVENSLMEIATENKSDGKGVGRFGALHQRKAQEFHPSFLCEISKNQGNSTLYQRYTNSIPTLSQLYTNAMVSHVHL